MSCLLFPHTSLSEDAAQSLAACFDRIHILHPGLSDLPEHMRRLIDDGFLRMFAPVTGGERDIEKACREYEAWTAEHPGVQRNAASFQSGAFSFQGEQSPHGIRSEIRTGLTATPSDAGKGMFRVRLFLCLAQLHDIRQEAVARDMHGFASKYRRFLADLKGDAGETGLDFQKVVDDARRASDYMIAERLTAWASLMAANPLETALFVTHRRSVLEEVCERLPEGKPLFSCRIGPPTGQRKEELGAWRSKFMESLETLSGAAAWEKADPLPLPPEMTAPINEPALSLEILLFPHLSPDRFITGLIPREAHAGAAVPSHVEPRFKHTLVGLLDYA
jgi:hypothetical protein